MNQISYQSLALTSTTECIESCFKEEAIVCSEVWVEEGKIVEGEDCKKWEFLGFWAEEVAKGKINKKKRCIYSHGRKISSTPIKI